MHGGSARQVRAAAARRLAENRALSAAAKLVPEFGASIPLHPVEALLGAVARSAGLVAFFDAQVAALAPRFGGGRVELEDGTTDWRPGMVGPDHLGDGAPHIWLKLLAEERDRLARTAALAQRAGVSEVYLAAIKSASIEVVELLRGVLEGLGLDPSDPRVREVVRQQLEAAQQRGVLPIEAGNDPEVMDVG